MSQAISDPQLQVRSWQPVAGAIDHTLLEAKVTQEAIIRLCHEAHFYGFAAICVNPCWINLAVSVLQGTGVKIATTIGFPLGASQTTVKRFEAEEAILTGAQELEVVMNIGALKSGDRQLVQADIAAVTEITHQHGALVKVILETGLLSLEEKILSCELALAAGADFVKTASGFAGSGATVDDVALLCGVAGDRARVKASGGIRTATSALALLEAGASRLGTSHGVSIIRELDGPDFSL
ncbi:MAG TPA: deoxyribose-phosphate aldolase [Candidatus Saccharimonadales bacterium]|jgi:deoxyribose-phosphate aldolase|nr:deoxyribose-phosphate aldolase [Candidatus Saccharimonadales bacterium]